VSGLELGLTLGVKIKLSSETVLMSEVTVRCSAGIRIGVNVAIVNRAEIWKRVKVTVGAKTTFRKV
jgi:hypothetical protein